MVKIFVVGKNINILAIVKPKFKRASFIELTNSQWQIIENLIYNGRKRKYNLRRIFDALLKQTRTGG